MAILNTNGSASDCQTQINAAANGDTILFPAAGNFTWDSAQISIPSTKGLTINFNGSTINQGTGTTTLILIETNATKSTVITGGTFIHTATTGGPATIRLGFNGSETSFGNALTHITNCTFTCPHIGATTSFVYIYFTWPLIDNCTFIADDASEMIHNYSHFAGNSIGWSQDITPGSNQATYVENCTFQKYDLTDTQFNGCSAIQSYDSSRIVFRYNTCIYCQVDCHGTAGQVWCRWWEIYNNTFVIPDNTDGGGSGSHNQFAVMDIRGGSGVIFNNTTTGGVNAGSGVCQLRVELPSFTSAILSGNVVTVTALGGVTFWFHTGDTVTISGLGFVTTNPNGNFVITRIDSTHFTYSLTGANETFTNVGSVNTATAGEYPMAYQIGRGKSSNVSSPWDSPQALDPAYCWNNVFKSGPSSPTSTYSLDGRDFFSNTQKPGYTPYQYPYFGSTSGPVFRRLARYLRIGFYS